MRARNPQTVDPWVGRLSPQPNAPTSPFLPLAVPSIGFACRPLMRRPQASGMLDEHRLARDERFQPSRTAQAVDLGAIAVVAMAVAFGPVLSWLMFG